MWICFADKHEDILDVFLAAETEFKALYNNSEIKKNKQLNIRVASLSDIKDMKKASGRNVDLADIRLIEEAEKYRKE